MLGFHDIAEAPAILRNSAAVPIAVASHRSQILERPISPKHIHDFLKLTLEFPSVELVVVVRPPGVVESFSGRSEIHPHMAYRAQHCILGLVQLGIEKARLLTGSGPQRKEMFCFDLSLAFHKVHLLHFMNTSNTTTFVKSLSLKTGEIYFKTLLILHFVVRLYFSCGRTKCRFGLRIPRLDGNERLCNLIQQSLVWTPINKEPECI